MKNYVPPSNQYPQEGMDYREKKKNRGQFQVEIFFPRKETKFFTD